MSNSDNPAHVDLAEARFREIQEQHAKDHPTALPLEFIKDAFVLGYNIGYNDALREVLKAVVSTEGSIDVKS